MISGKRRTYSELIQFPTFAERFEYLKLSGKIGSKTFGYDRFLNQDFYHKSLEWKQIRNYIIARDLGCDLAIEGRPLDRYITIHHMNPLGVEDFVDHTDFLLNPEYLICTSDWTHRAIHYGSIDSTIKDLVEREPNDTCPWKK